ncbi:MAG: hypothetical protein HOE69_01560 [Euryarchaeota archaeon]|jgi:hypothetical protein|nr:hypothetical protein [Euryarchaeota archaeon]
MIPIGIILIIIGGVMMYWGTTTGTSKFEEAKIFEGSDGEMELSSYSDDGYLVVVMQGEYADGKDSVGENGTAELTEEDCELVSNFTMNNSEGVNYFEPVCEISDDTTPDDGAIHIGYLCKEGCPNGVYTWTTNNNTIEIWDGEIILEGIGLLALAWGGGPSACCCGGFIAILGLILGFTLKSPEQKMALAQGYQAPGVMPQQQGTVHSMDNHPGNL